MKDSPDGQTCSLQAFVSSAFPRRLQSFPPYFGSGSEHVRDLECVPPSQLLEHFDHLLQSEYPPSMSDKKEKVKKIENIKY